MPATAFNRKERKERKEGFFRKGRFLSQSFLCVLCALCG
jgi:hypothetical protein